MLDYESGLFIELDLGFVPSPSGGFLSLFQQEEVHDGFLLLYGYAPSLDAPERQEAMALVTVAGVSQSVFGYPNEEAFWFDWRGQDIGGGFYEVQGSRWLDNVTEYNRRTYGSRNSDWDLRGKYQGARHFFIGSKDVSAQFLAQGLIVETFTDQPYRAVRDVALGRLDHWHQWNTEQGRPVEQGSAPARSYPDTIP
jgi:hypothetical protein